MPTEALSAIAASAKIAQVYGLFTTVVLMVLVAFFWLVWYVLKTSHEREIRLAMVIDGSLLSITKTLINHDQRDMDVFRELHEAMRQQQQEHQHMVLILQSLQTLSTTR